MWIARDKDKELCIFRMKPRKNEQYGFWNTTEDIGSYLSDENFDLFPDVRWTDKEPTEIKLVK